MKHTFCESFVVRRTSWNCWKMMLCDILITMGYKIHCDRIYYFFLFFFFFQWPSWNQRNKAKVLLNWTLFCAFWNAIACTYDVPATNNNKYYFSYSFQSMNEVDSMCKNVKSLAEELQAVRECQKHQSQVRTIMNIKWLILLFFQIFGVFL